MVEELVKTVPKSVSFEPRGTTHGLTAEEIAANLLGVHDGVFYLAMTIVGGQDHIKIVTHYLYNNKMPKLSQGYQMDDTERGKQFLWKLTHLALTEYVDPCRCLSCGGTKFINAKPCQDCKESGRSRLDEGQKARFLNIKTKRFQYWLPLYERIYNIASSWESEARLVLQDAEIA